MPLRTDTLLRSHNNVARENTVLKLKILETGVLTPVVQNASQTRHMSPKCFGGEPTIPSKRASARGFTRQFYMWHCVRL